MAEARAPGTVNRYLATLRHCFGIAVTDWEWCGKSPCQKIMLKEPRGRDRHLNDDEITALLRATKASPHPHLHAIVLIALTTGARRGEVTGLRWRDVDLDKGRAVLHETKNTYKRTLALAPQVIAELREIRKVRRIDDDLIFASPNPEGKRSFSTVEKAWQDALSEAGITDFRFHDLRHTFASRMAMDGKTLNEIAGALGHKTLAMVKRYAHLTEGHVHDAMLDTANGILGNG
jgi:integrase